VNFYFEDAVPVRRIKIKQIIHFCTGIELIAVFLFCLVFDLINPGGQRVPLAVREVPKTGLFRIPQLTETEVFTVHLLLDKTWSQFSVKQYRSRLCTLFSLTLLRTS
jgi:hypothetical protein